MTKSALTVLLTVMLMAAPAFAAPAKPSGELCAGKMMTLRISKITPNGTMTGFLEAVKDQAAWYKSHGFTDNKIEVARVLDIDPVTHTPAVSQTEALTLHWSAPGMAASGARDNAWDAFVAKFRANSTVETEKHLCVLP